MNHETLLAIASTLPPQPSQRQKDAFIAWLCLPAGRDAWLCISHYIIDAFERHGRCSVMHGVQRARVEDDHPLDNNNCALFGRLMLELYPELTGVLEIMEPPTLLPGDADKQLSMFDSLEIIEVTKSIRYRNGDNH